MQKNCPGMEDAPRAISPMRKESRRTWGTRRTMLTQREGTGDTKADPAQQQPLSCSLQHHQRWPKRPKQFGEPLITRWWRGGEDLTVSLEGSQEPTSLPGPPVRSALEGCVESSLEAKSGPAPGPWPVKEHPASSKKARGWDEQGDANDSAGDGFIWEGLQNRLPRKLEQEPTERSRKAVCSHPRKQRRADPSDGVEVQAGNASRKVPPCRRDTQAAQGAVNQAARDDRKCVLEAAPVQGPRDKDRRDLGKPHLECEVSNPSTPYCVCCQPQSQRLVICRDRCEEWFHGDCLTVSEAPGWLSERNGDDYVGPNCTSLQAKEERMSETTDEQGPGCRSGGAGDTEDKSSGAGEQKSSANQGSEGGGEDTLSLGGEEAMAVSLPVIVPCAGPGCSRVAQPSTVYCSEDCIVKHAAAAMRLLRARGERKPKPKRVNTKPEKLRLPKPSVQAGIKMSSVHKRPAPEEAESPARKVMATPAGSDPVGKEAARESSTPAWARDHESSAVMPEKSAAASPPCWGKSPRDHRSVKDRAVGAAVGPKETALPGSSVGRAPSSRSLIPKKPRPFPNTAGAKLALHKSPSDFGGPVLKGTWLWEAPAGTSAARQAGPKPVPLASDSKKSLCSAALMGATRTPVVTSAPGRLRAVGPAPSQPESQIRQIIRCSLKEILRKRVCESGDLIRTENEVGKPGLRLEKEMFNLSRVTDKCHRSEHRSVTLLLEDPESQRLSHQVMHEEISLEELIRMKPEELMSTELSMWKDRLTKSGIRSQHKGHSDSKNGTMKPETIPDVGCPLPVLQDWDEQQKSICTVHVKSTVPLPDALSSTLKDKMSQHQAHLFDLSCKMCTGQVLSEDEPAPKNQLLSPLKKLDLASKPGSSVPDPGPHLSDEGSAVTLPKDASELYLERASGPKPERSISESRFQSPQIGGPTLRLSHLGNIWKGLINMQSVGKFVTKAHPVSGSSLDLSEDLPDTIHIGGRIAPKTVWDYVGKLQSSVSKALCLICFYPATQEEEGAYASLYSYLRSCSRFGVVANTSRRVRDLYLVPLSAGDPVPPCLVPLAGPGLESPRPNLLLGLIITEKQKHLQDAGELDKMWKKRAAPDAPGCHNLPAAPQAKRKPPENQLCSTAEGSPPPRLHLLETPVLKTLPSLPTVATCSVTAPATAAPAPVAAPPVTLRPSDLASPLHFILQTLFKGTSFQAPPKDPTGPIPSPQQDHKAQAQKGAPGALLLDPIVQQFGHFTNSGPQEEVEEEDDRPYDPEEGYNVEPAFDTQLTESRRWNDEGKAPDTAEEAEVAYDPEDETFLEAASVTVADLPTVMCTDLREMPGEHTRYRPPPAWQGHQRIGEDFNSPLAKGELFPQEPWALDCSRGTLGTNHTSYSRHNRDPRQARHSGDYETRARVPQR